MDGNVFVFMPLGWFGGVLHGRDVRPINRFLGLMTLWMVWLSAVQLLPQLVGAEGSQFRIGLCRADQVEFILLPLAQSPL